MKRSFYFSTVSALALVLAGCGGGESVDGVFDDIDESIDDIINDSSEQSGLCPLPAALQEDLLWYLNQARAVERQCGTEIFPSAAPLAWNSALAQAAVNHSTDMAFYNFFSHTGSNGLGPDARLDVVGYSWSAWAENISAGLTDTGSVVDSWLDSPGHCANIMDPAMTEIGAACAEEPVSDYGTYWTLVFGRSW